MICGDTPPDDVHVVVKHVSPCHASRSHTQLRRVTVSAQNHAVRAHG